MFLFDNKFSKILKKSAIKMELTRQELKDLHDKFTCKTWQVEIENLLTSDLFSNSISIEPKLELIREKASPNQKEQINKFFPHLDLSNPYNYIKDHENSDFKVGDTVKVTRKAKDWEKGWGAIWNKEMDSSIDKTYKITCDDKKLGFQLNNAYTFPYFVFEKVEKQIVPFTFDDVSKFIGKPIKSKMSGVVAIIVLVSPEHIVIGEGSYHNYDQFLEKCEFLDGSPCGKVIQ